MYEVIRWISIAMLWVAAGFNICVAIRNIRLSRKLREQLEIWRTRNEQNDEGEEK